MTGVETRRAIYEWTCGHMAGAVCSECYRLLANKAHELTMEVDRLRDELEQRKKT